MTRIPRGLTPREPTFQVTLDVIALTPCYPAFLIIVDVLEICQRVQGREFDPLPSEEDTVSFLRDLGHIGEINSLNDVVVDQMHQTWRTFAALINRSLSGKTNGAVPPKIARKFQKASPTKKDSDLVPVDEEPIKKANELRDQPRSLQLSQQQALLKEVRKKSLRDFHKTHPSGSGTGAAKSLSVEKITPTITSEGTGDKLGVPDVTEDDSTKSESESWGNDEDDSNDEQESKDESKEEEVDQENESEDDEIESDEDKRMDDTTDQFDDDVA
ncbi:hypothetical protein Tco_0268724 [Tanacetum coccineum]